MEGNKKIHLHKNNLKMFIFWTEGTEVPSELRDEADELIREIQLEGLPDTAPMDDEYLIDHFI